MADLAGGLLEDFIPVVKYSGIRSNKDMTFGDSATVTLPATTTIGGQSVVALGNITSSSTTATAFSVTNSGVFTGTSVQALIADSLTTGTASLTTTNGQTSGHNTVISSTGTIVTTGDLLSVTGNTATTSTGIVRVSATGLTTGFAMAVTSGGANLTTGGALNISNGASTAGTAVVVTSTGVMTTTAGLLTLTGNSATTASGLLRVNGLGLTTGLGLQLNATAATLTTGRYLSCNDAALEVFGIGANGHIHTTQTTAPTIGTNATGISACAVTAGSTDVCGTITTTGTPASGTVLTITFNKTYTTAPKFVTVEAANAAAGGVNTPPIVTQTATTIVLTWPAGGVYAATPSFTYFVVA